jgi:hypothetical protein
LSASFTLNQHGQMPDVLNLLRIKPRHQILEIPRDIPIQTSQVIPIPRLRFRHSWSIFNIGILELRIQVKLEERIILESLVIWIAQETPARDLRSMYIVGHTGVHFVPQLVAEFPRPSLDRFGRCEFGSYAVCDAYLCYISSGGLKVLLRFCCAAPEHVMPKSTPTIRSGSKIGDCMFPKICATTWRLIADGLVLDEYALLSAHQCGSDAIWIHVRIGFTHARLWGGEWKAVSIQGWTPQRSATADG